MELKSLSNNWKIISLENLEKAEWNYKTEDEEMGKKLEENIKSNGQIENIIVRNKGNNKWEVVNGNHRYDVFKKIGITDIVVYDLGECSIEEAKLKAVLTNETKFGVDVIKLGKIIKDISLNFNFDEVKKSLPFDDLQIDSYLKLDNFSWDNFKNNDDGEISSHVLKNDPFELIKLSLPEEVAKQFLSQINRIKKLLNPTLMDDEIEKISPVSAIECICQHLAQMSDFDLVQ